MELWSLDAGTNLGTLQAWRLAIVARESGCCIPFHMYSNHTWLCLGITKLSQGIVAERR
jgi:hypothetical protein